jgi:diguanylate cyclase (GGDEF)-like protein/PAS domain S-box-containing protein
MNCSQLTPVKYEDSDKEQLQLLHEKRRFVGYEKEYIHKNGHLISVRISSSLIIEGEKRFILSNIEDITEKKRYELALKEASLVFDHTHEGIMITDANKNIIRVNSTFTKITGYTSEEVLRKNPRLLQSGVHDAHFYKAIWEKINSEGIWYGEIKNKRKNGEYFTALQSITAVKDDKDVVSGYVSVFSDISERKKYELQLAHTATHDSLTTLPNRVYYNNVLDKTIRLAKRNQYKFGVLFIDLNYFKEVNDTLGHEVGDLLLREVAQRILGSLREEDTVARLGGDEFAIILNELRDAGDALIIIEKIVESVERPFYVNEHLLVPSLSIGVSIFPDDGVERTVLLNNADMAMYKVKQKRELKYQFYQEQF